jgi:hypothetical protein
MVIDMNKTVIIGIVIFLAAHAIIATENLFYNGSFEKGLAGFKTIKTLKPSGKSTSTITVSGEVSASGKKSLKILLSPQTARHALLIRWLPVSTLKKWQHIRMNGKVRFNFLDSANCKGSVSIKIREWNKKYLGALCSTWQPFTRKQLRVVSKVEGHTFPKTYKDFNEKWLAFQSIGKIHPNANSTDFMIDIKAEGGKVAIFLDDIVIAQHIQPPLLLQELPNAVKQFQKIMPLKVKVTVPEVHVTVTATKGKWQKQSTFKLKQGLHTLPVKISEIPLGRCQVNIIVTATSGRNLLEIQKITECVEDPFAE